MIFSKTCDALNNVNQRYQKFISSSGLYKYKKPSFIYEGAFGKTFKCERKPDGLFVCLKCIDLNKFANYYPYLENEINL
jgi:hypothetical protein